MGCGAETTARRPQGRRLRAAPTLAALLLLRALPLHAAAFLPGQEADPPTGPLDAAADATPEALAGSGIRWAFAPPRWSGSVSLDLRALRLEDGTRLSQQVLFQEVGLATYVHAPWFAQLRAGLGVLVSHDGSQPVEGAGESVNATAATGHLDLAVFPMSRFPFELRAEWNDSRASGDGLGADYRSQRLGLHQSWRPADGRTRLGLHLDLSRLRTDDGVVDTVRSAQATAQHETEAHSADATVQLVTNDRSDEGARSRIAQINAHHAFQPGRSFGIDTMASWSQVTLRSGVGPVAFDGTTELRQIASLATWRPAEGEPLHRPDQPVTLTATARLLDASSGTGGPTQQVRAASASLGAGIELTRSWRLAASLSGSRIEPGEAPRTDSANASATATWNGDGRNAGAWRWQPSAGLNAGLTLATGEPERRLLGVQLAHSLDRQWAPAGGDTVGLSFTQSLGALRETQSTADATAVAHAASLNWQSAGDGATQGYAALSLTDSRSFGDEPGRFQLVNAQWSGRRQTSRHASWSGNLTLQAVRSRTTVLDVFTGMPREGADGWQRFYSGALSYEQQRAFEVPRLRFTAIASVNSQQYESRALGDLDALNERITASLESRLDYAIGRLEARLSARAARIEGRTVGLLAARLQRRF